jgi:hypothetical protein
MEGHRIGSASNRDLTQKLTYQQLLNLNHDLSKENLQLKNIGKSSLIFRGKTRHLATHLA